MMNDSLTALNIGIPFNRRQRTDIGSHDNSGSRNYLQTLLKVPSTMLVLSDSVRSACADNFFVQ